MSTPSAVTRPARHAEDGGLPWISVFSPTLTENASFRTHCIVKLLEAHYRVQLIAFGHDGEFYEPLKDDPSARPDIAYHAETSWRWWRRVKSLAPRIRGEALVAIKPRMASFGAAIVLGRKLKRPVIVDVDDWEPGFLPVGPVEWEAQHYGVRWLTRFSSPLFTRWLDGRVTTADDILVSNSFLQGMFGGHWIPHFRDVSETGPTPPPAGPRIVLFMGQPRAHKGLPTLLQAWQHIEHRQDAVLRLVVPNPAVDLVGLDLAARKQIDVSGTIPFADLPHVLSQATVIVVPQDNTRASLGQLPVKLLDGMAAGRAIVATDVGDAARWLHGDAGLIVPPSSPTALAGAIAFMLDHPDAAQSMGQRAQRRLQALASHDVLSTRLRQVVDGAIAGTKIERKPAFDPS